jgi:hypothetical protein
MADIKVRVGQQNAIKVVSSISGSNNATTATNVIGGIASVTQLYVSGISSFSGDVFINGNFFISEINGGTY